MDKYLSDLFKDGLNKDGDVIFAVLNGVEIRCHSFILTTVTNLKITPKTENVIYRPDPDYPPGYIINVLNKLYNSAYKLKLENFDDSELTGYNAQVATCISIMKQIKLLDELKVLPKANFKSELGVIFGENIVQENWIFLLTKTVENDIYRDLTELIVKKAVKYIFSTDRSKLPSSITALLFKYFSYYPLIENKASTKYIINNSRYEYITVSSDNSADACDSIVYFLFKFKAWRPSDSYQITDTPPSCGYSYKDRTNYLEFYKRELELSQPKQ